MPNAIRRKSRRPNCVLNSAKRQKNEGGRRLKKMSSKPHTPLVLKKKMPEITFWDNCTYLRRH